MTMTSLTTVNSPLQCQTHKTNISTTLPTLSVPSASRDANWGTNIPSNTTFIPYVDSLPGFHKQIQMISLSNTVPMMMNDTCFQLRQPYQLPMMTAICSPKHCYLLYLMMPTITKSILPNLTQRLSRWNSIGCWALNWCGKHHATPSQPHHPCPWLAIWALSVLLFLSCQQFSMTQHHLDAIEWQCCLRWLPVAACSSHCSMQLATMMAINQINQSRPSNSQAHCHNLAQCSILPCQQSTMTQHHLAIAEQWCYMLWLPVTKHEQNWQ